MKDLKRKLTSNEVDVMIETIKDNNASEYLKNSYKKILDKFNIDYTRENYDTSRYPKKAVNTYNFDSPVSML